MKNVGYSFFQDLANKGNPHSSFFIYMQLVTPSVVAMAVRILMAICRIVFQVFLFMIFLI